MLYQLSYSRGVGRIRLVAAHRMLTGTHHGVKRNHGVNTPPHSLAGSPLRGLRFERFLFIEPFQRELDQSVYQVAIGDSGDFPELGKHADPGETGDRIEFVYQDFTVIPQEEIDPGHALAGQYPVDFHGGRADLSRQFGRQRGRNLQLGAFLVNILGFVRIELVGRPNFPES